MPFTQRIESLKKRHAEIEEQLHLEEARPAKDEVKATKLKRDKLSLKEEILRLEAQGVAA
ncbi:MAG TPA: hypothetical protein DCY07_01090 [Rhodospirillaceae bacterium]|nr:hypothetical protein [Rhodospirillaceae bacterium]